MERNCDVFGQTFGAALTDAGLSTRAIAPVVGVTDRTVLNDRQVRNDSAPAPTPAPSFNPGPRGHETMTVPTHVEVDGVVVAETRRVDLYADEVLQDATPEDGAKQVRKLRT